MFKVNQFVLLILLSSCVGGGGGNSSSSNSLECADGFIKVPKNSDYIESNFCVAKFEMKSDGQGGAQSSASGTPITNLTKSSAISFCQQLGAGYDLISNAQWQTIARNLASVNENWVTGSVGATGMFRGHSDNSPASLLAVSDENDGYDGTSNNSGQSQGSGLEQKRSHKLTNGEIIWDFAGNALEFVKDSNNTVYGSDVKISQITMSTHTNVGSLDDGELRSAKSQFGPKLDHTSLGAAEFGGLGGSVLNASAGAVLRGGAFGNGTDSGVFYVSLFFSNSVSDGTIGFRCVHE